METPAIVRLEIWELLLLLCEELSWKRSKWQNTLKVRAIFEPITLCHTIHDTHAVISVGQSFNVSPKHAWQPKSAVPRTAAPSSRYTPTLRHLTFCTPACTLRRCAGISELTSFQAHVSLKRLPSCAAKFRAWPTRLVFFCALGSSSGLCFPCHVKPHLHAGIGASEVSFATESDDAHETSWCHMAAAVFRSYNPLRRAAENQILHLQNNLRSLEVNWLFMPGY